MINIKANSWDVISCIRNYLQLLSLCKTVFVFNEVFPSSCNLANTDLNLNNNIKQSKQRLLRRVSFFIHNLNIFKIWHLTTSLWAQGNYSTKSIPIFLVPTVDEWLILLFMFSIVFLGMIMSLVWLLLILTNSY